MASELTIRNSLDLCLDGVIEMQCMKDSGLNVNNVEANPVVFKKESRPET